MREAPTITTNIQLCGSTAQRGFEVRLLQQRLILLAHHVVLTWAMKSMVTTTMISNEVPPK